MARPDIPQDVGFEAWRAYPLVRAMRQLNAAVDAMPGGDPDDVVIAARRAYAAHMSYQTSFHFEVSDGGFQSAQITGMMRRMVTERLREMLQSAARSVAAHPRHWSSVWAKQHGLSSDHSFRWTPSSLLLPVEELR